MNNKVDKLFKDKLENDSLQPSAQAWEKVEAHLGKKNKMVLWRVAAAILLIGFVAIIGLKWNDEPAKKIAVKDSGARSQEQVDSSKVIQPEKTEAAPKKAVKKKFKKPIEQKVEVVSEPPVAVVEQSIIETISEQPRTSHPEPSTKGITLTYSLPLIKKDEPVVAEVPKKTKFERVLEIAKEVKNAESPLAELREAKNDILAFEFKKDKNRKN